MAAANNNQGRSIILSTHTCDKTILPSSSQSQESEIIVGASSGGIDSPCHQQQKEQPQSDKRQEHQEKINECSQALQHGHTSSSTTRVVGHNGTATSETNTTTSMERANNNNNNNNDNNNNNNNNNSNSSNNNNCSNNNSCKSGVVVVGPRERLKRHRREVAGNVWIPEMWGQEDFLKDWIDCTAFDASLVPQNIMIARASLMEEARRATSPSLTVENSC